MLTNRFKKEWKIIIKYKFILNQSAKEILDVA